ncbi:MAG: hypothetical protein EHM72_12810 [Calditrichaeota bacterium]|nr:MAG: hypothetical protein EHM72_12810 [Calditrichota bacterium]
MVPKFQSLFPVLKERTEKELIREIVEDTELLIGLPYPYVTPGVDKLDALYYLDTYFINLGLLKLKLVNLAKHHVENLVVLQRRFGFIPASNLKSMTFTSSLPLLPWMVRDVYRATGDKEWLSRILADVIKEFQHWTSAPHVTPSGLYRFYDHGPGHADARDSGCGLPARRFKQAENYNPVDLNALLYRNAKLIYDLQVEADGSGDQQLLTKAESIKKLFHLLWNPQ